MSDQPFPPINRFQTEEERMSAERQAAALASAATIVAAGVEAVLDALCAHDPALDHRVAHLVATRVWRGLDRSQVERLACHAAEGDLRAMALETLRSTGSIDDALLATAASDPSWTVRAQLPAVSALPRAVLVRLLVDADQSVRRAAMARPDADRQAVLDALLLTDPEAQFSSVARSPLVDPSADSAVLRTASVRALIALLARPDLPSSLLATIAAAVVPEGGERDQLLISVLRHPASSPTLVRELASDRSEHVRAAAATHPGLTAGDLTALADDASSLVRAAVAADRRVRRDVLAALLELDPDVTVRLAALRNPTLDQRSIAIGARDGDARVRLAAVLLPGVGDAVLQHAVSDVDANVRLAAVRHPRCAADALAVAAGDEDVTVRRAVAAAPDTPSSALVHLADDRDSTVVLQVAGHRKAPGAALRQIVERISQRTRAPLDGRALLEGLDILRTVVSNPVAPPDLLDQIVQGELDLSTRRAALLNAACPADTVSWARRSPELVLTALERGDVEPGEIIAVVGTLISAAERSRTSGRDDLRALEDQIARLVSTASRRPYRWIRAQEGFDALPSAVRLDLLHRHLKELASDPDDELRAGAVGHRAITATALQAFTRDPSVEVRMLVAAHSLASSKALETLARDAEPRVRAAVAAHERVTRQILVRLADDPDDSVSGAATRRLLRAV